MKTIMKYKGLAYLIVAACFSLINYNADAQLKTAIFAGQWHLNEDKSDFGRLTAASAKNVEVLTIEQTAEYINSRSGDSIYNTVVIIGLNGNPSQLTNNLVINEIPTISKSSLATQWINDHTVVLTSDNPKGTIPASVKTYSLSPDLQNLTIDYKLTFGESELTGKLVYDKQKSH